MTGVAGLLRLYTDPWTTHVTWWLLSVALVAALACVVVRTPAWLRRLRTDRAARQAAIDGAATFVLALVLRLSLPPHVHYTFDDEYEYLAYAQQLAEHGRYLLSGVGPAAVYLWALGFAACGPSSEVAFAITIVAASATAPALAWLLRLLGVARLESLLAALALAIAPLHVKHAASASLEVLSLLALLLAVGSFVALLRAPGRLAAVRFALALLFALTVRAENWVLLLLLPLLAVRSRADALRAPPLALLVPALLVALVAAVYLPGVVDVPTRTDEWWRTRLPMGALLATNLGFWTGGDVALRKLPLAVALIGLVAALRRTPRVLVFWLAFAALYSLVFALYGMNLGWVEEPHQPPPWGARAGGHDNFRFNVLLLPVAAFLVASGLGALLRAARALLRGDGRAAAWPRGARLAALAVGGAGVVALALWRDEWRSYRPLEFVASPYNRAFEIAELRFLRAALAPLPRDAALYVLPPSERVFVDGILARPLASLGKDGAGSSYVYVNGRQLAAPQLAAAFAAAQERVPLRLLTRREVGGDRFFLLQVARPERRGG